MKYLPLSLVLLVGCLVVVFFAVRGSERYELLINNAQIVDGTGAPAVRGSIGVRGGIRTTPFVGCHSPSC